MKKILVVEDEYYARKSIVKILQESDLDIQVCGEAANGMKAIELLEEYKDIALVCGWYGEKKILDDILEYIWNNVQKDKNHPFFRNKDRGVEGWFEKIREESSDCERLHEICEKEIQKHKVGKLPYRKII